MNKEFYYGWEDGSFKVLHHYDEDKVWGDFISELASSYKWREEWMDLDEDEDEPDSEYDPEFNGYQSCGSLFHCQIPLYIEFTGDVESVKLLKDRKVYLSIDNPPKFFPLPYTINSCNSGLLVKGTCDVRVVAYHRKKYSKYERSKMNTLYVSGYVYKICQPEFDAFDTNSVLVSEVDMGTCKSYNYRTGYIDCDSEVVQLTEKTYELYCKIHRFVGLPVHMLLNMYDLLVAIRTIERRRLAIIQKRK